MVTKIMNNNFTYKFYLTISNFIMGGRNRSVLSIVVVVVVLVVVVVVIAIELIIV